MSEMGGTWPQCWCGQRHTEEVWCQHHCEHTSPLVPLVDPETGQVICPECGRLFEVEGKEPQ